MTNLCGSGGSASPKPITGMVNALGTTRSTCYQLSAIDYQVLSMRNPNDEVEKATPGRIALQLRRTSRDQRFARNEWKESFSFRAALGVRAACPPVCGRPRVALAVGRLCVRILTLGVLMIAPISIFGAAKSRALPQLPGYKAVPVHYGPLNKMIMSVNINGQPANLLVDTGSSQIILDADAAESFGVRPSRRGLIYFPLTQINGQDLPVGFAQNLTAGGMNFGSSPVVLRNSIRSGAGNGHVDGVLGLQILRRHKAVINFRTRLVFFKLDQTRQTNLSSVASSEKFTKVPLHREDSGALTVPCSIHGQWSHLLVDTGAFVTTFDETLFKSLGIKSEPTRVSAHFASGAAQRISAGQISDLKIGNFKVPPKKFGVAALPNFALHQGATRIAGILGMDTLYDCHAIIDLDGMNLFLK
jgi:predicted aspartyl protease